MYNPYNPYAYLYPNQQMIQQPVFPAQQGPFSSQGVTAQQSQQTAPVSAPAVLQVATIKQVEQAPVQPGGKALVLVANEPVIAMRTADNMGLTTTDYYHIERFDPEAQAAAPVGDYVTRAEFMQFVESLKAQTPAPVEKEAGKK